MESRKRRVEKGKRRLHLKASATIEALYILPVFFLVFLMCVYLGFYFHDKNVIQSIAYEGLVIGTAMYQRTGQVELDLIETFIEEELDAKLFLFSLEEGDSALQIESGNELSIYIKVGKTVLGFSLELEIDKDMDLIEVY